MKTDKIIELLRNLRRLPSDDDAWDAIHQRVPELKRPTPLFEGIGLRTPDGTEYLLSIQASAYHYCQPRAALPSLLDYEAVEVAVRSETGFVHPSVVGLDFGEGEDDVWPYVPVSVLVDQLRGIAGLLCPSACWSSNRSG